jgi:hypothetical protein
LALAIPFEGRDIQPPPRTIPDLSRNAMLRPALHAGERLPPGAGDRQPQHAERPAARFTISGLATANPARTMLASSLTVNPRAPQCLLRASERTAGQDIERAAL